jgi:sterol 3beta-glucosyltransferase
LSDEDSDAGSAKIPLSSSIHTIHRPVARSKRAMTTPQPIEEALSDAEEDDVREGALSDSGPEDGDFEREQPAPEREEKQGRSPHEALALIIEGKGKGIEAAANAGMRTAGSMATVRRKKRAQLADKLREVFELEAIKEVVAEMPCWLFRSISEYRCDFL